MSSYKRVKAWREARRKTHKSVEVWIKRPSHDRIKALKSFISNLNDDETFDGKAAE